MKIAIQLETQTAGIGLDQLRENREIGQKTKIITGMDDSYILDRWRNPNLNFFKGFIGIYSLKYYLYVSNAVSFDN